MVAYSFQKQFAEPILAGRKRQTIRTVGVRRHAREGDSLQLYFGMRTKHCRKLADATCVSSSPVFMRLGARHVAVDGVLLMGEGSLDAFAYSDGFDSWAELLAFWAKHHPGLVNFDGVLIRWGALNA